MLIGVPCEEANPVLLHQKRVTRRRYYAVVLCGWSRCILNVFKYVVIGVVVDFKKLKFACPYP